jgi:regulator of protease activity HflC (stomatin/prohibitin superfamily)
MTDMSTTAIVAIAAVAVIVLLLALAAIKVIDQYERGVRFRLGRVRDEEFPPGLTLIIPVVDRLVKVPMRIVTLPIQGQGIITRDNVSVDVSAVAYYRVVDAIKATIAIEDYNAAIEQIAQTTLRAVVGKHSLDQTLSETDRLNQDIRGILDAQTDGWGVEITLVELKDIQLPESMKRAMAREAEAEREKRAKIIAAEGERLAAGELAIAADVMLEHPLALQLRNLQTLVEISVDQNSTIIFPSPLMSTIQELGAFLKREGEAEVDLTAALAKLPSALRPGAAPDAPAD